MDCDGEALIQRRDAGTSTDIGNDRNSSWGFGRADYGMWRRGSDGVGWMLGPMIINKSASRQYRSLQDKQSKATNTLQNELVFDSLSYIYSQF